MGVLEDIPVRHLPTAERPGAENMALDAVAAERAAEGLASVRVYGWEPSTLSLGYAQDPETVDWSFCSEQGIHVTRRPTGGGGIYHDRHGDIAYSIVAPRDALPGDLMECYRLLCAPVISALEDMGVDVHFSDVEREARYEPSCYLRALHPSHDLVVDDAGGVSKISGNAQYRRKSAVVQHGSLIFHNEPERHVNCFDAGDLSARVFSERVTAIDEHADLDRAEAVAVLERRLRSWAHGRDGEWTDPELDWMDELVEQKFGARSWIEHREPAPTEA